MKKLNTTDTEAAALKKIWLDRKAQDKSLTQAKLAERCGYENPTVVNQYLNGYIPLNLTALLKFANVLSFNPLEVSPRLMKNSKLQIAEDSAVYQAVPKEKGRIPLIRLDDISKNIDTAKISATDFIYTGPDLKTSINTFAIRHTGISMSPVFEQGDKLIVDQDAKIKSGDFIVALFDGSILVRRLDQEDNSTYLTACNPHWPDKIITLTSTYTILGKIIRRITDF